MYGAKPPSSMLNQMPRWNKTPIHRAGLRVHGRAIHNGKPTSQISTSHVDHWITQNGTGSCAYAIRAICGSCNT